VGLIGRIHHIDRVDVAGIFLADALEHALGAGALDARRYAGVFRLERAAETLGELQVHRRIEDDLAFLLGRFDQRRCNRFRRRRRGAHRLGKHETRRQRGRAFQYVTPADFCFSHSRILPVRGCSMKTGKRDA
jgi:hypothetical protein